MWTTINAFLKTVDNFVWGVPLMVLILCGGILLTVRLGVLQMRRLPLALKWMIKNEEGGKGEISSFAALCTALSATIGTGNIVGVATAVCAGGPWALFWMIVAAFFGMATKFSEGLLAIKYRVVDKDGHSLGGPFYYIEQGMGSKWKWLAKIFAFFGVCVGLFGIGTFSQVNGIASAIQNFFDPNKVHTVAIPGIGTYSWTVVIASLILAFCVGAVLIGGKLPGITLAVMAVSDFFVHSWYCIIAIIAGIAIFIHAWKKTEGGAHMLGKFILKVPLVGPLSIKTASSRMTRTLSTLMGSGVQLVDALGLVTEMMGNAVVKQALKDATEEVSRGIPLSKPLADSGVFPPMVYHMIEIGEETGNMEDMLDKVAAYYDDEVESATEALLAAMEPLIIIVMALVVVPIVLAIMMPMYSLYDSIGA